MGLTLLLLILLQMSLIFANQTTSAQEVTTANNLFVPDIYKELLKDKTLKNFIYSALSAEIVLALTQSGTKGETGQQLRSALHLPNDTQKINEGFRNLLPALKKQNAYYIFRSANKIYVKTGFCINESFKNTAVTAYEAEIENIDFAQNQVAAQTINGWVENQTEHKIQNLIAPDSLDNSTRLVLVNALYLRGNWTKPFKKEGTSKQNFYLSTTKVVQVDTMHQISYFNYLESTELNVKFLEISLQSSDASVIFILPNTKDGLGSLESQDLSLKKSFSTTSLKTEYVDVRLPKFKINTFVPFTKILKALGVVDAFDKNKADLSGISGLKGDLWVSDVVQKAYAGVDEYGVEAAAATAVTVVGTASVGPPKPVPKLFQADHPFMLMIKVKDVIVFAGRVVDPSS